MNTKSISQRHTTFALALAAMMMIVTPTSNALSQTTQEIKMSNESTIRKSFDAWGKGTGSPYDLLADTVEWTIAGRSVASRVYTGREDFMSNVIRPFGARMATPLVPAIKNLYADGNTIILHFDAGGMAKDGKPYTNTYAWFLTFDNGKIVKATAFFDSIAFNDLWTRVQPE